MEGAEGKESVGEGEEGLNLEVHLNKMINPRPLTAHIMPCYTHKVG